MSTRTPPASEAVPALVPAPPSAPTRPRSAPPPGTRTVVAAVLVALAGTALLNAPPPARARTAHGPTTTTPAPETAAASVTRAIGATPGSATRAVSPTPGSPGPGSATSGSTLAGLGPGFGAFGAGLALGFGSAGTGLAPPGADPDPDAPTNPDAPADPVADVPTDPTDPDPTDPAPLGAADALAAPVTFVGKAFDTCEAPSLTVMKAWRGSPYGAVGIYFGGRGRGCPVQKELTPTWVASAHSMGWRLLPLFVGSQAPCVDNPAKRKYAIGSAPATQGTKEGGDAVRAAKALGIGTSSPLYLDIEAYERGNTSCAATTLAFVRAWNREVRRLGYLPGFYSSADTGVRDMEAQRRAGTKDLPDVMWFAHWSGQPALLTESVLHPEAWTPHARIHQYVGNVTETYGGRTLSIDRNAMDAPVARVTTPARIASRVPVPLSFVEPGRP
ncbi:glycoside hydrolase domain-containing protein [Streptomyces sp. NPDC057494]|uniref:glycoside hydrolase domain-containing protein n=1 Tax=Streptomyces sp. NPDC057494 TaxID=3346148 RepID=UPI0036AB7133